MRLYAFTDSTVRSVRRGDLLNAFCDREQVLGRRVYRLAERVAAELLLDRCRADGAREARQWRHVDCA